MEQARRQGPIEFEAEDEVSDIYADAVHLEGGPYGWTITFGHHRREKPARAAVRLRISPQMAKVFFLLLRGQLKEYERQIGHINIPDNLAEAIGIPAAEREVY